MPTETNITFSVLGIDRVSFSDRIMLYKSCYNA